MRKRVRNTISIQDIPSKLLGFIEFLNERLKDIPPENRATAEIAFDFDDYDSDIDISYFREETEAEIELREYNKSVDDKLTEKRERAYLAELKAKYGDTK